MGHRDVAITKKKVIIVAVLSEIHAALKEIRPTDGTPVSIAITVTGTEKREFSFELDNFDELLEILELNGMPPGEE